MNYIVTKDLSYRYNKKDTIIENFNIEVPIGSIYGLLGPNGAGKTTAIKLMLGLLKKQTGEILFKGMSLEDHRIDILKNIGSLIEAPSLYGHLSARENLQVYQVIYGVSPTRVDEVLEIVGIPNTGSKKASKFSLGMKQRLSIAIALLHNPDLLILDEPTNGLDPSGIIEMRELIIKLSKEHQKTILISSHLLSEVEKLITHVGIISNRKLVFQGSIEEMNRLTSGNHSVLIETNNNDKTTNLLTLENLQFKKIGSDFLIDSIDKKRVSDIITKLAQAQIEIYKVVPRNNDLESFFMEQTKS